MAVPLPCPHSGYDLSATPVVEGARLCSECGRESRDGHHARRGLPIGGWGVFCVGAVAINTLALIVGTFMGGVVGLLGMGCVGFALCVAAILPAFVLDTTPPGGEVKRSSLPALIYKAVALSFLLELIAILAHAAMVPLIMGRC